MLQRPSVLTKLRQLASLGSRAVRIAVVAPRVEQRDSLVAGDAGRSGLAAVARFGDRLGVEAIDKLAELRCERSLRIVLKRPLNEVRPFENSLVSRQAFALPILDQHADLGIGCGPIMWEAATEIPVMRTRGRLLVRNKKKLRQRLRYPLAERLAVFSARRAIDESVLSFTTVRPIRPANVERSNWSQLTFARKGLPNSASHGHRRPSRGEGRCTNQD